MPRARGVAQLLWGMTAAAGNMNGDYHFANQLPGTNATHRSQDYFDVYVDLESVYGEVNWGQHNTPLDPAFVAKYDGKMINIVGMEFDIVRKGADGAEVSIPSWEQYNHHYNNMVMGKGATLVKTGAPSVAADLHGTQHLPGYHVVSAATGAAAPAYSNQFLPMGNGAESRKSFHFFPPGYGALVESPNAHQVSPMIIDTANRDGTHGSPSTRHGVVPTSSNVQPDAMYSGLMECPCTDKWEKHVTSVATKSEGTCAVPVASAEQCFEAAAELGLSPVAANRTESSAASPQGCHVTGVPGGYDVVFNTAASAVPCGATAGWARMTGTTESLVDITVDLRPDPLAPAASIVGEWSYVPGSSPQLHYTYDAVVTQAADGTYAARCVCTSPTCSPWSTISGGRVANGTLSLFAGAPGAISADGNTITFANGPPGATVWRRAVDGNATITLSGPGGVWFGAGFGAADHSGGAGGSQGLTMVGTPWAIVVSGSGVEERKLGNHEPGTVLAPTVAVVSDTEAGGRRTVVLARRMRAGAFNFGAQAAFGVIDAVGASPALAHHKQEASATMYLVDVDAPTCVCKDGSGQGTLVGREWGAQRCHPRPWSQLFDDPKWADNDRVNPTCLLKSYRGGLRCCTGGTVLLDRNQTVPQTKDNFQLKYRYYFEEVAGASAVVDTFFTYWWTEYNNNEHDVPACRAGEECTYQMTSNFTAGDMMAQTGALHGAKGIELIHVHGHCHIGCQSMELWIMDDPAHPRLLCKTKVVYGTGDAAHDEMGYILGNEPCIFGRAEDGYETPTVLKPTTKLMSVGYQNNTVTRYGDMTQWQIQAARVD